VGGIGIIVVIATCLAGPVGYYFVAFGNLDSEFKFRVRLSAERAAKYIYLHPVAWNFQAPRFAELIESGSVSISHARQRILTSAGELVVEVGAAPAAPAYAWRAGIEVAGKTVGRAEIVTSLRPLLRNTALAACISCVLGIGMYFAVRRFPLSVLDDTLGKLQQRDAALEFQNSRFDAALSNMSQGLAMFDADGKLTVSNRRFREMFDDHFEILSPGTDVLDIIEYIRTKSAWAGANVDLVLSDLHQFRSNRTPNTTTFTSPSGRVIEIHRAPSPDGGWVDTFSDVTARCQAEAHIAYMARHDVLTGLPNRADFYERIDEYLTRARRGEPFAVFMLDLDDFKSVNDSLGHPAGDQLLRSFAARLRDVVGDIGFSARFGGDEFVVIAVAHEDSATKLAEQFIQAVCGCYELEGHSVHVSASIGVALAPADGSHSEELVKNADLALHRAKGDRGGTFRFFEAQMDERVRARRLLEADLRTALAEGQFDLFYQPLVSVTTGRVVGLEALIRWRHPLHGLLSPAGFIKVAEETGLIVPMGAWALERACVEATRWPDDIRVEVNVSPVQFRRHNQLVVAVEQALRASGLPPSRLELEITESVLLDDDAFSLSTLHRLRDMGVRIAMDDFGTGYSALGYLRKFPFDKIKIDQMFVRDLAQDASCLAIVRAIVGLSTSLGITTTAEGVETLAQFEQLRFEGCDEVQGFLFSAPRPSAEIDYMLRELRDDRFDTQGGESPSFKEMKMLAD
jgi:diguanylate cyclase (GGDEF)-like protein